MYAEFSEVSQRCLDSASPFGYSQVKAPNHSLVIIVKVLFNRTGPKAGTTTTIPSFSGLF